MTQTILILEDNVQLALQWSSTLKKLGYTTLVTHGAEQALQVLDSHRIDLCIVDFMVHENGKPSPNGGLTFLGKMSSAQRKQLKLLGVSGLTQGYPAIDAKEYLLAFGAEYFLAKPFTDAELVAEINRVLLSD